MKAQILLLMMVFLSVGCQDRLAIRNVTLPNELGTKAVDSLVNPYFVSAEDVLGLIERRLLDQEEKGNILEFETLEPLYYEGTVVFYLARFNSRWELFASDKRLPYLLAYSDTEDFDYSFFMDIHSPWAENYLLSSYRLRTDSFFLGINDADQAEIADNVDFWNCKLNWQKVEAGCRQRETRDEGGHWELTEYYEDYVSYSQTNHMLPTDWHQFSPYNSGCPTIPGDPFQSRYTTGSSALAMALLLYHYHNNEGVPEMAPSAGFVQLSPIDSLYHYYPTHYSSTVWNNMTSVPDSCSALLGLLRYQTGTRESGSNTVNPDLASFTWFVNNMFSSWGLSGQMTSYGTAAIDMKLEEGFPVVVFAASGRYWVPFEYHYTNNHTYLVDAFIKCQKIYCYFYEWIPDDPDPAQMIPGPRKEIVYGPISIRYYGINFCGGDNASTVWFAKSDAVTYYNNTYQYIRHILGDVAVLDE